MKVGITGHQDLGSLETITWLRYQVEKEISNIKIDVGYSCLALGADQLFADILLKRNIPFIAVIPCRNYEQTFEEGFLDKYKFFFTQAFDRIHLDYEQPSELAFLNASKYMINNCEIMIAIWNGLPAKGLGGTADVVAYATKKHKKVIHINPISKTFKHF